MLKVATADAVSLDWNVTVTMSPVAASVLTLLFDEISNPPKLDGAVLSNVTDPDGAVVSVVTVLPVLPAASTATMLYATTPSLSPDTSTYVHLTLCVCGASHDPLPEPTSPFTSTTQLGDSPAVPAPPTVNVAVANHVSDDVNDTVTTSPTLASVLTLLFDEISNPPKLDGAVLSNVTDPDGAVASVVTVLPVLPAASTATMLYATTPSLSPDTSTYVHVTFPDNT